MKNQIRNDYANWLISLAYKWCCNYGSFKKLMEYLYFHDFTSLYANDGNRIQDGIEMRFRFIEACDNPDYTYHDVYKYLTHNCNILEVMIALARRCEDHIMGDPDAGDQSGVWFWGMIRNMHLDHMTDENYSEMEVEQRVNDMLSHNYKKNGDGGLFSVRNPNIDMRQAEIWYQMNWHLGEIYDQF